MTQVPHMIHWGDKKKKITAIFSTSQVTDIFLDILIQKWCHSSYCKEIRRLCHLLTSEIVTVLYTWEQWQRTWERNWIRCPLSSVSFLTLCFWCTDFYGDSIWYLSLTNHVVQVDFWPQSWLQVRFIDCVSGTRISSSPPNMTFYHKTTLMMVYDVTFLLSLRNTILSTNL